MSDTDGPPADPERAIESYLDEIAAKLDGPASARRDIMAELATGVVDTADAYRYGGLDPAQAARAAIAEFGSPDRIASGFRDELGAATARRTALTLMTAGFFTAALFCMAGLATHVEGSAPAGFPAGARLATLLAFVAASAAIGTHMFTLATTGRLTRWLPARPVASTAIAAGSTAAADIAMLAALTIVAAATPATLAAFPLAAAGAASLTGFILATRAARSSLATRAMFPKVGR